MTRQEIYEEVIPLYFLQRKKKEYRVMIESLVFAESRLFPDRNITGSKKKLNDKVVLSIAPS